MAAIAPCRIDISLSRAAKETRALRRLSSFCVSCVLRLSRILRLESSCSGSSPMFFSRNFFSSCSCSSRRLRMDSSSESKKSLVPTAMPSRDLRFSSMKKVASPLATRMVVCGSVSR